MASKSQTTPELDDRNWHSAYIAICEVYRLALFNALYTGKRLTRVSRENTILEVSVAVLTAVVAGLALLKLGDDVMWAKGFAVAAAIVAAVKPVLQLNKAVLKYASQHAGYLDIYYGYKELVARVQVEGRVTQNIWREHENLNKRYRDLAINSDPDPSLKFREALRAEVDREIPAESLRIR